MKLGNAQWFCSPIALLCILQLGTVPASARVDGPRYVDGSLQWHNIRCFEGRAPKTYTKWELHPQLFVAETHLAESQLQVIVQQFRDYKSAKQADIICISRPSARQVKPLFIPCPFLHGRQSDINVNWTFQPASPHASRNAATGPLDKSTWRVYRKYLYMRRLSDADRGTYTCKAARGRKVWKEEWDISKTKNDWIFTWKSESGDSKSYKIRNDTGEVIVLPHASKTWLRARLDHANNSDYL